MAPCLEVAVFSGAAGLQAQDGGAHRIELNAPGSYNAGGLTPPLDELESIVHRLTIPVRIMIRPRGPPSNGGGEDFLYTEDEVEQMLREIRDYQASGMMDLQRGDGFVFGALRRGVDGPHLGTGMGSELRSSPKPSHALAAAAAAAAVIVDEDACRKLVAAARPFPCVFHRAFDVILTAHSSEDRRVGGLASVIACGFKGILTAGGPGTCADNVDTLTRLLAASGQDLQIIAGGGLRSHNAAALVSRLVADEGPHGIWTHTAALRPRDDGSLAAELDTGELSRILAAIALE